MQNKQNVFMYPMWAERILVEKHPYINHLVNGLSKNFKIINYGQATSRGIRDLGHFFSDTDIIYLNWIESSGYVDTIYLIYYFFLSKISNKKIVWTHHNRVPHKGETRLSKFITRFVTQFADFIIAHTEESYPILKLDRDSNRVLYFFHPLFSSNIIRQDQHTAKKLDLLIWGNVRKSKGVQEFLKFLKATNRLDKYKIKIVGKFETKALYDEFVNSYNGESMEIENRFVDANDLDLYHAQARHVFFPYTGESVLNSGALITSLPKGTAIIGPATGAFKELGSLGLIKNYKSFEDVLKIVDIGTDSDYPFEEIRAFCERHTWENFSVFLKSKVSGKAFQQKIAESHYQNGG